MGRSIATLQLVIVCTDKRRESGRGQPHSKTLRDELGAENAAASWSAAVPCGFSAYRGLLQSATSSRLDARPTQRKIRSTISTRREFLASSAAALAAAPFFPGALAAAESAVQAPKPLRILILGGTGFLGPACTDSAIARGHSVTHFNSGRTNGAAPPAAPRSSPPASSSSTATGTRIRPRTTAGTTAKPKPRRIPTVPRAFPSSKGRSGMR